MRLYDLSIVNAGNMSLLLIANTLPGTTGRWLIAAIDILV